MDTDRVARHRRTSESYSGHHDAPPRINEQLDLLVPLVPITVPPGPPNGRCGFRTALSFDVVPPTVGRATAAWRLGEVGEAILRGFCRAELRPRLPRRCMR